MENSKEYSNLRYEELKILHRIGQDFSSSLNFDVVIKKVLRETRKALNCEAGSVLLYDNLKDALVFFGVSGKGEKEIHGVPLPRGKGIAWWSFSQEKEVIVNNARRDDRFYPEIDKKTGIQTKTLISVPIKKEDLILGVIEAVNKKKGIFTTKDLVLLRSISHFAALSLDNSIVHRNLREKKEALERINEEMHEFIHVISHDLQTPLASIRGYADLLYDDLKKRNSIDEETKRYVEGISRNVDETLDFIRKLLIYVETRKEDLTLTRFSPDKVLEEVIISLKEKVKGIQGIIRYDTPFFPINFDRNLFYSLLYAFLLQKFAKSEKNEISEVHIGVKNSEKEVTFFLYKSGEMAKIEKFGRKDTTLSSDTEDDNDLLRIELRYLKKVCSILGVKIWEQADNKKRRVHYISIPHFSGSILLSP